MRPTLGYFFTRARNALLHGTRPLFESDGREMPYRARVSAFQEHTGACFANLTLNQRVFMFTQADLRQLRTVLDEACEAMRLAGAPQP